MSGSNVNVWQSVVQLCRAAWGKVPAVGSRLYVFITLVLPVLTSIGTTWTLYQYQFRDTRENKEKSAFIDESRAFDAIIANYVQHIMADHKSDVGATQQLSTNLIKQTQLLSDIAKYIPKNKLDIISDYSKALVSLRSILPESNSVLTLKAFWEDTSKILVLRNRLISQLQT